VRGLGRAGRMQGAEGHGWAGPGMASLGAAGRSRAQQGAAGRSRAQQGWYCLWLLPSLRRRPCTCLPAGPASHPHALPHALPRPSFWPPPHTGDGGGSGGLVRRPLWLPRVLHQVGDRHCGWGPAAAGGWSGREGSGRVSAAKLRCLRVCTALCCHVHPAQPCVAMLSLALPAESLHFRCTSTCKRSFKRPA